MVRMIANIHWLGDDVDVEVSYQDGYFKQAYISGPPEDCYPAEGEMPTVTAVLIDGGADILALLTDSEVESLEEKCWKDQQSREPHGP